MLKSGKGNRSACLRRQHALLLLMLAGALALSGCTTAQLAHAVIPAPTAEDKAEARALVESLCDDAGTHIHRTVDDVEGFEFVSGVSYKNGRRSHFSDITNGGCGFDCVRFLAQGYRYIEIELRGRLDLDSSPDFANDIGLYRYRLVRRPHPACEKYDRTLQLNRIVRGAVVRHAERFDGMCIEAVPVAGEPSRYIFEGYFTEPVYNPSLSGKQFAFIGGSRVLDRTTRKELAVAISYNFRDRSLVGGNQAQCGADRRLEITDVLKPLKS